MTFAPGTRLGSYEIVSALDVDGIVGEVYRAHDHDQHRDVAIRVLRVDFDADPQRLRRFEPEVRAAAVLTHPNILTVHDVGTDAHAAYIVSDPIEGETLRESLNRGALPASTAIPYAMQVARGLAAAHEKGVVHRDLKPENILVTAAGRVQIVGFGLAAVTQNESALVGLKGLSTTAAFDTARLITDTPRGVPLGTLSYMSPEQVRGDTVDQRSDMFAFGAIVYEMLTGTRAFSGDTPVDTMTAVLKSNPPPLSAPDIPPVLSHIVDLSLKKNAGSRLSAEDVAIGLQGFWAQPAPDGAVAVPRRPINVRRIVRTAAVLGAIAVAALAGPWLLRVARTAWMSTVTPPSSTPTPPPPTSTPSRSTLPTSRPPAPTPPGSTRSASTPPTSTPPPPRSSTPGPPASTASTPPRVAAGPQQSQLVWFDREGTEVGRVGEGADYGDVSLSPDGMRVAVSVRERGSDAADIWVFDVASGMGTRLTSDPADDIAPVWSPDGRRILFASSRRGSHDIYQKAVNGDGNEVAIIDAQGDQIAYDWSSDGRYLVYQTNQPRAIAGGNLDLWARPLPGGRPFAFLRTVHAASRATFSPDGSWAAYTSIEGGREDVYVARFPRYEGRRRISARGGSWSRWRRDGSEIFYLDPENRLMAVPLKRGGSGLEIGAARPLFQLRAKPNRGYSYDVAADGQRFLVNALGAGETAQPIALPRVSLPR